MSHTKASIRAGLWGEFESNPAYDPQAEAQARDFEIRSDITLLDRGVISIGRFGAEALGETGFRSIEGL